MELDEAADAVDGNEPNRYRFTVEAFNRMAEAGVFGEEERVELIDGAIYKVSPSNPPHAAIVNKLARMLILGIREELNVRVQSPNVVGSHSQPEPDVVVADARSDDYMTAHPTAEDTIVAIEVSDTTYRFDRNKKVPMYARAGVPTVWIVDVNRRQIEIFTDSEGDSYRTVAVAKPGDSLVVPGTDVTLDVAQIFPA